MSMSQSHQAPPPGARARTPVPAAGIYYGWYVVAACVMVTFILGGPLYAFGVFFKPLENEFGWSRSVVSSGATAYLLGHATSIFASGRLVDRFHPRPILIVGAVLAGLGISLASQIHNVAELRGFLFLGGLGTGAAWSVPNTTVQRWFYRRPRAGLALAIVVTGIGLGALVFAPLINFLIQSYGWRNAYIIVGIIFFVLVVGASFIVRPAPETVTAEETTPVKQSAPTPDWRHPLTSPLIAVSLMMCVTVLANQVVSVHLVPYATDLGISATVAAAALGLVGGFTIPSRLVTGFFSERLGWRPMLAWSFFLMALSYVLLIFTRNVWMLYVFVLLFGLCHGSRIPAQLGILGEHYDMRDLGRTIGIASAVSMFFGAFAPYIAGFIFDTTGSYLVAFFLTIGLLLAGGSVALALKRAAPVHAGSK